MIEVTAHTHTHTHMHTHRYINSMNRRDLTYKLAVNHMADYSDDEMKMMRGYRHDKTSPRGLVYMPQHRIEDLPADVDWWLRGGGGREGGREMEWVGREGRVGETEG